MIYLLNLLRGHCLIIFLNTFKEIGVPDLPYFPRHNLKAHGVCGWDFLGLNLAKLMLSNS